MIKVRKAQIHPEYNEIDNIREKLAALCHEQWSGWMRYLFDKGHINVAGEWVMPPDLYKRWQRQMNTTYVQLSEAEQNSDRAEADKFIGLLCCDSREE